MLLPVGTNKLLIGLSLYAIVVLVLTSCSGQSSLPLPSPFPTAKNSPTLVSVSLETRIAAGFTPTSPPTLTPFPIITNTPTPEPSTLSEDGTDPLTGYELPEGAVLSRPLLVKLANWPETIRPATGLNQADMVFEYYIGHQMNHLMALYLSSSAETVGPLAHARLPDRTLTELYQGNLAIYDAEKNLRDSLSQYLPNRYAIAGFVSCPGICADFSREQERSVVNVSALTSHFEKEQGSLFIPDLKVNAFSQQSPASSELAKVVSIEYADFSVMQWRYDEASNLYQLWQDHRKADGKYELTPSYDDTSGSPIAFENLIVVYGKYLEFALDNYDFVLKADSAPGQALFFRDGRITFGRWKVNKSNQPIQFSNLDGSLYGLKPGSTWVVFVSEKSKSNQSAAGEWQISFSIK